MTGVLVLPDGQEFSVRDGLVLGRVATGLAPKEPVRCVHRGMTVESPQHAAARAGEAHATDR